MAFSFQVLSFKFLGSIILLHVVTAEPFTKYEKNFERTLGLLQHPKCSQTWCKTNGSLSYIVAKGKSDELHHLFCTVGAPSLMISRTKPNADIQVDYDLLFLQNGSQAIYYKPEPIHSFGMIFSNLYEFDDFHDSANMSAYRSNHSANYRHELTNLTWTIKSFDNNDPSTRTLVLRATASQYENHTLFKSNGYIDFTVRYDSKDGRLDTRPHMEHTANSTIITVEMANLTSRFPNSRFALELIMFSTENGVEEHDSTQVELTKSLDDEYSPGVFEMRNWFANNSKQRSDAWGYAQWKPVVYTKSKRLNADLSKASSYPNFPFNRGYIINNTLPERSLCKAYFGNEYDQFSVNATNVSFGTTGDKFFKGTNYLVWTMGMGLGPAPEDDVSMVVILVIAVGLGIPLVLMIAATLYVCTRSIRKRSSQSLYTAIND